MCQAQGYPDKVQEKDPSLTTKTLSFSVRRRNGFVMPCLHLCIYSLQGPKTCVCEMNDLGLRVWYDSIKRLSDRHETLSSRSASMSHCCTQPSQATGSSNPGVYVWCFYGNKASSHCLFVPCWALLWALHITDPFNHHNHTTVALHVLQMRKLRPNDDK